MVKLKPVVIKTNYVNFYYKFTTTTNALSKDEFKTVGDCRESLIDALNDDWHGILKKHKDILMKRGYIAIGIYSGLLTPRSERINVLERLITIVLRAINKGRICKCFVKPDYIYISSRREHPHRGIILYLPMKNAFNPVKLSLLLSIFRSSIRVTDYKLFLSYIEKIKTNAQAIDFIISYMKRARIFDGKEVFIIDCLKYLANTEKPFIDFGKKFIDDSFGWHMFQNSYGDRWE